MDVFGRPFRSSEPIIPAGIFRRFVTRNCGSHYCTPGHLRITPSPTSFFIGIYGLQIIRFPDTAFPAPEHGLGAVLGSFDIQGRTRGKPEGPAESGCSAQESAESAEGIFRYFR